MTYVPLFTTEPTTGLLFLVLAILMLYIGRSIGQDLARRLGIA